MKDLKNFIYETSINAKKRNVNFIKNLLLNGKNVGKIGSFVIFTAENPSLVQRSGKENKKLMNDFNKELKRCHYVNVPIDGYFAGNKERSRIVFNMKLEIAKEWNKKYDQTSFFYVYPTTTGFIAEYWEKTDNNKKADRVLNPYIKKGETNMQYEGETEDGDYSIISNDYKFYFDSSLFESINDDITKRLNIYCENKDKDPDEILEYITNRVGIEVLNMKKQIFF